MKICFFIANLDNLGGTERVTTVIANALVNDGYDVNIISWWGGKSSFYPLDKRINCYHLFNSGRINIYTNYISSLVRYRSVIKKIDPDIIVDVCVPLSLITIPATYFSKVKRISWEHFNVKVNWNFFTAKLARWLASNFCNLIVVLTKADYDEYYKRYGARNVIKIVNPLTVVVNQHSALTSKNVIAVGRLTHQKGFDLLLQAWHYLLQLEVGKNEIKQWKLNIVGGGEEDTALKQLCSKLGLDENVRFIEPTKDIEAYYKNATIFVLSSRFEGLPLALIEAKAFGLPTISFDCETGPREVISDHIDGLLVEAGNYKALAVSIASLINNPATCRQYANKSLEKAKTFALPEIVAKWNKILVELK